MNPQTRTATSKAFSIAIVAMLLLVSGVGLVLISAPVPQQHATTDTNNTSQTRSFMPNMASVGLEVKAYHHGDSQPFATRDMPNDLIVDPFNDWLLEVFNAGPSGSPPCANLPARSGQQSLCNVVGNTGPAGRIFCQIPSCGLVFTLGEGVGTSGSGIFCPVGWTPLRTNYLQQCNPYTPYGSGTYWFSDTAVNPTLTTTASPATCNTGATDTITGMGGTQQVAPQDNNIKLAEVAAGLYGVGFISGLRSVYPLLIFDDAVSPFISLSGGDTVTVTYTLNLASTGFNNNMCKLLAGYLAGNIDEQGHVQVTLTNTASGTANFYAWCQSGGNETLTTTSCTSASETAELAIGTGTPTFTPASVDLGTRIGQAAVSRLSYTSSQPAATMFWTTSVTLGTSNTITEAGGFLNFGGTRYLLYALTFAGQTQTASVPFTFTTQFGD